MLPRGPLVPLAAAAAVTAARVVPLTARVATLGATSVPGVLKRWLPKFLSKSND